MGLVLSSSNKSNECQEFKCWIGCKLSNFLEISKYGLIIRCFKLRYLHKEFCKIQKQKTQMVSSTKWWNVFFQLQFFFYIDSKETTLCRNTQNVGKSIVLLKKIF